MLLECLTDGNACYLIPAVCLLQLAQNRKSQTWFGLRTDSGKKQNCLCTADADPVASVIFVRAPLLHQMLQTLLQVGRGREAEVLTHSLAFLGGLLPATLQPTISQWALQACEDPATQVSPFLCYKSIVCSASHVRVNAESSDDCS